MNHGMAVPHPKRALRRHFLRQWREFRGLTQEQAGDRLGITRSHLSKIEASKAQYTQGLLEAAAIAYDCTVADLLMRDPSIADAPWSIYETLKKAPDGQRKTIEAVIESILKTGT